MLGTIFLYLCLTILLEWPVYGIVLRKKPWWQVLLFVVLINGFTHPILTWLYMEAGWNLWVLEGSVAILEGLLVFAIWRMKLVPALATGIFANGFSLWMGWVLMYLEWIPS